MPPGRCNFQGAFGPFLALDVGQIFGGLPGRHLARLRWLKKVLPGEVVQDSGKVGRGEDRGGLNPSGFGARGFGANQAAPVTGSGERRGQAAGDLYQIAPQGQLTHENAGANLLLRDHAQG